MAASTLQQKNENPNEFSNEDFILIDHYNYHYHQKQQHYHKNPENHHHHQQINKGNRNLFICRMIELEKNIFYLMFHLIETYYRPIINQSLNKNNKLINKTKEIDDKSSTTTGNEWYCQYRMPSKRIHGLKNLYKKQFEKNFNKNLILSSNNNDNNSENDNNYLQFHRNNIDWQLVFATISGFPYCKQTNQTLANRLNFDSLFDYEDAITQSAYLLINAKKHSQLIDNLVLNNVDKNKNNNKNNNSSTYGLNVNYNLNYNIKCNDDINNNDFYKLINMIEKLIEIKKEQMNECLLLIKQQKQQLEKHESILHGWIFFKHKSRSSSSNENIINIDNNIYQLKNLIENLRKEISSWEELIDLVNIIK